MLDLKYEEYLQYAIEASLEAGRLILEYFNSKECWVEHKMDGSPVTEADKAASFEIVRNLKPLGLPVLSEEGHHLPHYERKAWNTFWLIDPLDGTKEFLKGSKEFTVNVALIEKQRPVIGVINIPCQNKIYYAAKGIGAYRADYISDLKNYDDFKVGFNHIEQLPLEMERETFTIVGSKSHRSQLYDEYVHELARQYEQSEVIYVGSSIKLCLIAEGTADIYPRFSRTMEWDTAAGHAILNEAGGRLLKFGKEKELKYNKKSLDNPNFIGYSGLGNE